MVLHACPDTAGKPFGSEIPNPPISVQIINHMPFWDFASPVYDWGLLKVSNLDEPSHMNRCSDSFSIL
jgi:hypothetical protein